MIRTRKVPARSRTTEAGRTVALLFAALLAACAPQPERDVLVVGATTTLDDSGLLERLLAAYDSIVDTPPLRAVIGGTGQVLTMGRRGDVDLVITHDPAAESAFVAEFAGVQRLPFMTSRFLIAGPAHDPADAAAAADAVAALAAIARAGATFVSRGDDSGTHRRELALWREVAGHLPASSAILAGEAPAWYVSAGLGMADALRLAAERGAYILTEEATFDALRSGLSLEPMLPRAAYLPNPYAVTVVAETESPEAAADFARWLTSPAAQRRIASFRRDQSGAPLFEPVTDPHTAAVPVRPPAESAATASGIAHD